MRILYAAVGLALASAVAAQESEALRELLDAVRETPSSDDDCEISEELMVTTQKSAEEEVAQAVARRDFRYLAFEGRFRPAVPGLVYAFESCPDTSENLKLALPENSAEDGPVCGERLRLYGLARDFAGTYNSLMRGERRTRAMEVCTDP